MEMRRLGSNGPKISVIGLGTWEAGGDQWGKRSDDDTIRAMHAAIDAGMNWIDTAESYGGGRSEELIGEVLRDRRDEVLVFTKVAHWRSDRWSRSRTVCRSSRSAIATASCRRSPSRASVTSGTRHWRSAC